MSIKKIVLFVFIFLFVFTSLSCAFSVKDYFGNIINIPDIPANIDVSNGYLFIHTSIWGYELKVLDKGSYFYHDGNVRIYLEGTGKQYKYQNGKWGSESILSSGSDTRINNAEELYFSTYVYKNKEQTGGFWYAPDLKPYIMTSTNNLAMLDVDFIMIDSGTVDIEGDYFDFIVSTSQIGSDSDNVVYSTKLNSSSEFYKTGGINGDYYEIPVSIFKNFLITGNYVYYTLLYKLVGDTVSDSSTISVVYGGTTENTTDNILNANFGIVQNLMKDISSSIEKSHKESEETQKGILATIKEVVSFINPLSDNFFVYKFMDLLLDLLIKVFVPSNEFFSDWFADLNEYFGDRFGLLYYPFELAVDILDRVKNLSNNLNGDFILKFPDLQIMGATLIPAYEFNFNQFLENDTFKNVYNVYLTSVDVILVCALVALCKNTFVEIFGGQFSNDIADTVNADTITENRVARKNRAIRNVRRGGR